MFRKLMSFLRKLVSRRFVRQKSASAVSFVISMLIIGMVVSSLVGVFAYNIATAQANASVIAVPGGVALLSLLTLLFIIIPVVIFAKAAK